MALVPVGLVGAEDAAPYVPSLVPPSAFSCFLILAKLKPYLVVCLPKTFESVANTDLLNEKSLYGPNAWIDVKPFPVIVGTRPLVTGNANCGRRPTMSGEFA